MFLSLFSFYLFLLRFTNTCCLTTDCIHNVQNKTYGVTKSVTLQLGQCKVYKYRSSEAQNGLDRFNTLSKTRVLWLFATDILFHLGLVIKLKFQRSSASFI